MCLGKKDSAPMVPHFKHGMGHFENAKKQLLQFEQKHVKTALLFAVALSVAAWVFTWKTKLTTLEESLFVLVCVVCGMLAGSSIVILYRNEKTHSHAPPVLPQSEVHSTHSGIWAKIKNMFHRKPSPPTAQAVDATNHPGAGDHLGAHRVV
jgi:hypothetical protein